MVPSLIFVRPVVSENLKRTYVSADKTLLFMLDSESESYTSNYDEF